jgi:hypothetical protein
MLASLSDLGGECGETKTTRKNKVKKKPWQWDSIHQEAFDDVKKLSLKRWYWPIQTSQSPLTYTLMHLPNNWERV